MIFVCSLFSPKILFFFFCIVQGVIFYFCQNNCDCASDCSCSCSICTRYKDESQNQFQHLDRVLDGKWISYIPLIFLLMSNASGVGLFLRLSMFSCFSVPLKTKFTQNVDFGRQFWKTKGFWLALSSSRCVLESRTRFSSSS